MNEKTNKQFDLSKCLNEYGNVSKYAFYIHLNNKIPSVYSYEFNNRKIDLDTIDEKKLQELFPNLDYFWSTRGQSEVKTSAVEENYNDEEEDTDIYIDGSFHDLGFNVYENDILWVLTPIGISCYYNIEFKQLQERLKELFNKLPYVKEKPKEAEVKLVAFDGHDYYTITSKVNPTKINLKENYNDDFLPVHEDIIKFLNQRESGLIILSSPPGCGKSYYIRHLLSQYPKDYIIVTTAMASHLASPEFIGFMMENKNSIFILEDCEQILIDRSENSFIGAITNILNMSDGLMSDIFNMKFICTFNADINKIDQALLRKGRCYARYEFKALTKDKVENFAKVHNIKLPEIKEMTLGELYNIEVSDDYKNEQPKRKKIGF